MLLYLLRLLPVLLVMLAIDWYAYQPVRVLMGHSTEGWRRVVMVLYWLVPVVAVFYSVVLVPYQNPYDKHNPFMYLRAVLFIVYLSKLVLLPFVFADDLRRAACWVYNQWAPKPVDAAGRSRFLATAGALVAGLPLVTLTYGILRNAYRFTLFGVQVGLRNLHPDLHGLKIVQISDIHAGSFTDRDKVARSVDMINRLQPDLVFFTGDLVNAHADEIDDYLDIFSGVRAKYGVFSVMGNHDYGDYVQWPSAQEKRLNVERLHDAHRGMGWQLLLNEHRVLSIGEARVAVLGVEFVSAKSRFARQNRGDLARACQQLPPGIDLQLLLSHDPSHWEQEVLTESYRDIAITFSGHTHGMQFGIEIPGWVKWSPVSVLYKQWAGLYSKEGQYLYVNRGLGFLGYPGRVGILPEITLMELKQADG